MRRPGAPSRSYARLTRFAVDQQQFNYISPQYAGYVETDPFRQYLHYPAVLESLRTLPHERVLDVGCGDGTFAEVLATELSCHVTGHDVGPAQIETARERQSRHPSKTTYLISSSEDFRTDKQFTVATSIMVLPYARSVGELFTFFRSTHAALCESGAFVSIIFNPAFRSFGTTIAARRFEQTESNYVKVCFLDSAEKVAFSSILNQFSRAEYEKEIRDAGFGHVELRDLHPTLEGVVKLGRSFWTACEETQPYQLLVCRK